MSNEWRGWMNLNRKYIAKRPDRLLLVGTLGPAEIDILAVNVTQFAIVRNDAGFDFAYRALGELEDALDRAFPTAPMVRPKDDPLRSGGVAGPRRSSDARTAWSSSSPSSG